ncbi:MAG: SpoIIE family protein phosphatase [Clostridia bacterium]|nr:SpoIIE family protein phosphatase [Clostridia bacterium]
MINAQAGTRYKRRVSALRLCSQALYMAIAARAALLPGASPFAVAFFTAGLYAGLDFKALLAGCVAGFAWEAASLPALGTFAGCLASLGSWALIKRARNGKYIFNAWLDEASNEALSAANAMLPGAIAGLVAGGDAAQVVACSLVSMSISPVLGFAFGVRGYRTALLPEERMSLAAVILIAMWGLANSPLSFLVGPFAALITLTASYSGPAFGAAAGAVAGVAAAVATGEATLAATLSIMGLTAGLTLPLGRGWSSLSFILANTALALFVDISGVVALSPAACVATGVIYALIKEETLEKISGWMCPACSAPDASALASRLRQASARRLEALQKVFETLADGYGDFPCAEDEQSMTGKLRDTLCEGCPGYEKCWSGNDDRAGRLLCGLIAETLKGNPLDESDELAPEKARNCRRAAIIPRRLAPLLRRFDQDRKRLIRSRDNAQTLSRHFSSAGKIISGMVESLDAPLDVDNEMCATAVAALEREGISDARVIVMRGEGIEVAATRDEIWLEDEARQAQRALSKALGQPMRAAFSRGGDVTLRLVQAPRLCANVGYACRPMTPGALCGDSYVATGLNAGRVLIALSDGMGAGTRAAGESQRTVELIRRFMTADIDDNLALDAINQLLLIRNADEMFATADICVIDLNAARAKFVKQGACASYIVRDRQVEKIEGGKLPLGILDEVCPGARETELREGDIVVMITDGVCDEASDEALGWLTRTLISLSDMTSDAMCREIIKLAGERGARDDMTAIAVSVAKARTAC